MGPIEAGRPIHKLVAPVSGTLPVFPRLAKTVVKSSVVYYFNILVFIISDFFHYSSEEIGREERLANELFRVDRDVKPYIKSIIPTAIKSF